MLRKEWSLIVNSIVIQLAAGLFTFLAAYKQIFIGRIGGDNVLMSATCGMIMAGPIILTGMILSLFHLGQPLRAYRALSRIGSSWLSREVFFTGAFFVLWAVSVWMDASGQASMIWIWLAAAAGLLSIWSMSGIYAKTGKPGWSESHPYISFFGTFIIFGSVYSTLVVMSNAEAADAVRTIPLAFLILALLTLVIRFIRQIRLLSELKAGSKEWSLDQLVDAAPLPLPAGQIAFHQSLILWGTALSFSGLLLALYLLMAGQNAGIILLAAIAALTLTGELLGRMGFNSLGITEEAA